MPNNAQKLGTTWCEIPAKLDNCEFALSIVFYFFIIVNSVLVKCYTIFLPVSIFRPLRLFFDWANRIFLTIFN